MRVRQPPSLQSAQGRKTVRSSRAVPCADGLTRGHPFRPWFIGKVGSLTFFFVSVQQATN
jgi:hypothetical protein